MRKTSSLPELHVAQFAPEKTTSSGWLDRNKNRYKFQFSEIVKKNFDVYNLKFNASVFPFPRRSNYLTRRRKTRNNKRSYDRITQGHLSKRFFSIDRTNDSNETSIVNKFTNKRVTNENLTLQPEFTKTPIRNARAAVTELKKQVYEDDSDIFAVDESNRENEESTNRYVGEDAFDHYYKNYK